MFPSKGPWASQYIYTDDLQSKCNKNPEYKVLIGHNNGEQWEEIVAYNDLLQMIQDKTMLKTVYGASK